MCPLGGTSESKVRSIKRKLKIEETHIGGFNEDLLISRLTQRNKIFHEDLLFNSQLSGDLFKSHGGLFSSFGYLSHNYGLNQGHLESVFFLEMSHQLAETTLDRPLQSVPDFLILLTVVGFKSLNEPPKRLWHILYEVPFIKWPRIRAEH